jgi:hypothetical protein
MIAFQDFVPQRQGKRLLGILSDYENLHEVVSRANIWIEQNNIDVLNVETVLVTNLQKDSEASPRTQMDSQANVTSTYQIVRIWYRERSEADKAYTGRTMRLSMESTTHG